MRISKYEDFQQQFIQLQEKLVQMTDEQKTLVSQIETIQNGWFTILSIKSKGEGLDAETMSSSVFEIEGRKFKL